MNKVDCLGRSLNVGDYVIYTGRSIDISLGKIVKFTKVLVQVTKMKGHSWGGLKAYPQDLFLITEEEAKNFHKHLKK